LLSSGSISFQVTVKRLLRNEVKLRSSDQRIELLGSKGLLSVDNVLENTVSKATAAGVVAAKPEFFFLERYMRAYSAEWAAFVDAVTKNSPLPVTLADGVNALAVAEAATRSAKTKSTVDLASVLS